MKTKYIYNIESHDLPEKIGNKAKNLQSLMAIRGIKVPVSWVIPWDIYQNFDNGQADFSKKLLAVLQASLDKNKTYAVRSNSNIEDSSFHSFAGLFESILHVQGYENLRDAVVKIWNSTQSEAVYSYLEKHSMPSDNIQMAVLIQEMVTPLYSGVLFNRNPMTGTSEIVIEGVPGEGSALVQDGVTPERWVSRRGNWITRSDLGIMPEPIAKKVLDESTKILKIYKNPIDLEWVYDGKQVYWVQMREITTLKHLQIYSNRISKDVMPGMIHPLIWSINVPLINTAWLNLLEEIVGQLPIQAEDLAKSFFFRSYFNMGAIGQVFTKVGLPSEGLEILMGVTPSKEGMPAFKPNFKMMRLIPRLIQFLIDKLKFKKKITVLLPEVSERLSVFSPNPEPLADLEKQVAIIDKLNKTLYDVVYLNVVTPLLANLYSRIFEKQLARLGIDFLRFDLYEDMGELRQYNPNEYLSKLNQIYSALEPIEKEKVHFSLQENFQSESGNFSFHAAYEEFIDRFGHISTNSNNFMAIPWREDPQSVLNMIREYKPIDRNKENRIGFNELNINWFQKPFYRFLYSRARQFNLFQEKVSAKYIYGYGLFRPYFLRLAEELVKLGWIENKNDIFYLTWEEITQAISLKNASGFSEKIRSRQEEMRLYQDVLLPEVIYGDDPPPVFSGSHERLQGTPTSQGYYAGPIKIVKGIEDFGKVVSGDVIVIPYSDVGWTPLFNRAGAVIAESGGLLSHSSIIAREYQIPAVVSVRNCMILKDNLQVSVNGFTGEIVLLDDETGK